MYNIHSKYRKYSGMDLFKENHLKGKILDDLCMNIINIGYKIRHPVIVMNTINIYNKGEIDAYETLNPLCNRNIEIYLLSLIFIQNNKKNEEKYTWTLINKPNNKKELRDLMNLLYNIKHKTKNNIDNIDLVNLYHKYEKYLPDQEEIIPYAEPVHTEPVHTEPVCNRSNVRNVL